MKIIQRVLAALFIASIMSIATAMLFMTMSSMNPDKTTGGAYSALCMLVVPIVFMITLLGYSLLAESK